MSVSMQAINVMRFQSIGGLKSTQDRQERQQKCASQVEFFEKQKENLKNIKCDSLEEVARKLEMFHSYEDQIAAAKQQYNNSQMQHVLDEAREIGEKIAEAAEEMAPKTPEEREKERIEEATGTEEENKGMLSEIMDEMTEVMDEMQEELEEELEEATGEELLEEVMENPQETAVGIFTVGGSMLRAGVLYQLVYAIHLWRGGLGLYWSVAFHWRSNLRLGYGLLGTFGLCLDQVLAAPAFACH